MTKLRINESVFDGINLRQICIKHDLNESVLNKVVRNNRGSISWEVLLILYEEFKLSIPPLFAEAAVEVPKESSTYKTIPYPLLDLLYKHLNIPLPEFFERVEDNNGR